MTCVKCGGADIYTRYHRQGCDKPGCGCAACDYGAHEKRHDEHLHRFCRGCGFDWTDDVAGVADSQSVPE